MEIDELFTLARNETKFSVPSTWTQGRTIYGGLTAALIIEAIHKQVSSDQVLRSIHCNFSAPSKAEETISIHTSLLREGKTISQWSGQLIQDETVCVQLNAVFDHKHAIID